MLLKSNTSDAIVEKGQFVLIPPNFFHRTELSPSVSRYAVLFTVSPSSREGDSSAFGSLETPLVSSSFDVDYYAKKAFGAMKSRADAYKIKHYLTGLFISLTELTESQAHNNDHPSCGGRPSRRESLKIRGLIDDIVTLYYAEDDLGGKIADAIHMSRRNTARIVNKLFSCSLSVLVTRQRMNCALSFIRDTDMALYDISAKVGYNTYSAFYKAFKKYYGKSPEEYRV